MPNRISEDLERKVCNLYNNGNGTMEISKETSLHRATIQTCLKRNNIKLRKGSPQNHYNIKFFSQYTPESCYWAGFIAADGYIRPKRNTVHIKLSLNDKEHLEKFSRSIEFEGTIFERTNGEKYKVACIDINGSWFVEDLKENFGLVPNKTFNVNISQRIPKEMIHHFVRGYFDGDGCITKTPYSVISFTSGSKKMLEQLKEICYNIGARLQSQNRVPPTNHFHFSYSGQNAKLICDWMYQDAGEHIRLERKFNRYKEYLCQTKSH